MYTPRERMPINARSLGPLVALEDLVRHPGERAVDRLRIHDDAAVAFAGHIKKAPSVTEEAYKLRMLCENFIFTLPGLAGPA